MVDLIIRFSFTLTDNYETKGFWTISRVISVSEVFWLVSKIGCSCVVVLDSWWWVIVVGCTPQAHNVKEECPSSSLEWKRGRPEAASPATGPKKPLDGGPPGPVWQCCSSALHRCTCFRLFPADAQNRTRYLASRHALPSHETRRFSSTTSASWHRPTDRPTADTVVSFMPTD